MLSAATVGAAKGAGQELRLGNSAWVHLMLGVLSIDRYRLPLFS